jgi:hypothetical protein
MIAMEQNFIYRPASLIAFLLLAVLLLPHLLVAAEPDGNSAMIGNDTPQALVATFRHALAGKEWRTCFLCYDKKMRAQFLVSLIGYSAVIRDAKLDEIIDKRIGSIHEVIIPSVQPESRAAKDLRMYEPLEKHIPDLPGFVDEMCRRIDALGKTSFSDLVGLRDISIQGDSAVGHVNPSQPIYFCKIDGKWYMTIPDPPPPLSASERAKQLQAEVDSLWVLLCCSETAIPTKESDKAGAQPFAEKQYGEVRMSVRPFIYSSAGPTVHLARLTRAQATKLIEYLATEGYLEQAVEPRKQEPPERDRSEKNCYSLQVSTKNLELHEDLGWGPGMLKRLDGLRGALDGEAAQAMDAILAGLADECKK